MCVYMSVHPSMVTITTDRCQTFVLFWHNQHSQLLFSHLSAIHVINPRFFYLPSPSLCNSCNVQWLLHFLSPCPYYLTLSLLPLFWKKNLISSDPTLQKFFFPSYSAQESFHPLLHTHTNRITSH